MELSEILRRAVTMEAADIFIVAGTPVSFKVSENLDHLEERALTPDESKRLIEQIYAMAHERPMKRLLEHGDDDFSFAVPGMSRFRISAYKQRGSLAAVIRVVPFQLPDPERLGLPTQVMNLADYRKGMVLVTGPAGSGKSTTLACLIDRINHTRCDHIITLEDPIEFLHTHDKSLVSQREIAADTDSFVTALRASLRQAPDVILLGEMRDAETIATAMTAAETGHLVFSTLHTIGAANTVNRVLDSFPPEQQPQVRIQLSMVLQAVVSQQLIPNLHGGISCAFEVMTCNNAIRNMIRESKFHQMDSVIFSSGAEGMMSMDGSLAKLYRDGIIGRDEALSHSMTPEALERSLNAQTRQN